MQFASALVEYLAAGIAALLWLRPLAQKILNFEIPINEASVVLVLPMAYVLGIYIDSTSSFVIRWIGHLRDKIITRLRKSPLRNAFEMHSKCFETHSRRLSRASIQWHLRSNCANPFQDPGTTCSNDAHIRWEGSDCKMYGTELSPWNPDGTSY